MPRPVRHVVHEPKESGAPWLRPVLLAVLVAVFVFWPDREEPAPGYGLDSTPASLVGYWSTDDPRYEGRFLRLNPESLESGVGEEGEPIFGLIRSVSTWTEEGFEVVRLEYSIPGGTDALEIFIHGVNRLRLRNPPEVVWTRS